MTKLNQKESRGHKQNLDNRCFQKKKKKSRRPPMLKNKIKRETDVAKYQDEGRCRTIRTRWRPMLQNKIMMKACVTK